MTSEVDELSKNISDFLYFEKNAYTLVPSYWLRIYLACEGASHHHFLKALPLMLMCP